MKYKLVKNQWYEPRGKPRPPIPQQAAGNLPGEIKKQFSQNKNKGMKYISNCKLNVNLHLLFKDLKFNSQETILKNIRIRKQSALLCPSGKQ